MLNIFLEKRGEIRVFVLSTPILLIIKMMAKRRGKRGELFRQICVDFLILSINLNLIDERLLERRKKFKKKILEGRKLKTKGRLTN